LAIGSLTDACLQSRLWCESTLPLRAGAACGRTLAVGHAKIEKKWSQAEE